MVGIKTDKKALIIQLNKENPRKILTFFRLKSSVLIRIYLFQLEIYAFSFIRINYHHQFAMKQSKKVNLDATSKDNLIVDWTKSNGAQNSELENDDLQSR